MATTNRTVQADGPQVASAACGPSPVAMTAGRSFMQRIRVSLDLLRNLANRMDHGRSGSVINPSMYSGGIVAVRWPLGI